MAWWCCIALTAVSGCDYRWTSVDEPLVKEMLLTEIGLGSKSGKTKPATELELQAVDKTPKVQPGQDASSPANQELEAQGREQNAWIDQTDIPVLQWEIIYLGNRPVGYTRRSVELATQIQMDELGIPATAHADRVLCIEAESRIRISRKTAGAIDQAVSLRTLERPDGQLLGIQGSIDTGVTKRQFSGVVNDGILRIEQTEDKIVSSNSVPWEPHYQGPFAIEQSLRAAPMQLKEVRIVRYLDPFQMAITESRLEAISSGETIDFTGQFSNRVEIENRSITQGRNSNSLLWIDEKGVVRKTYTPGIDRQTYDCDPVTARLVISREEYDATAFKDLPLFGSFPKVPESGSVLFRLESELLLEDGCLSQRTNQQVQRIDNKTWDVEVTQPQTAEQQSEDAATDATLASSGLIDWKEPVLQRWIATHKSAISESVTDPSIQWSDAPTDVDQSTLRASSARAWVAKTVARVGLDRNIQTPATTIRDRKGDCIDHAILLTAALRSLKIPARVAVGFRAEASTIRPTCQLHLWVEYHDTQRWIPLDSFIDSHIVPLDRVKIAETTMPSINAYEPILNVVRLISDIEITARTKKP